jgi:WXG100 family type VII secretion target
MSVHSYDESVGATAHGDIGSVAQGVSSSLDELGSFVSRVKSSWEGDELDSYAGIQQKWDSAAATVREILTSVQGALGQTNSSVSEMRGRVRGAIQG